jgi:hypothetical protein
MTNSVPDKDVHISLEDQQKINKFARHNQKMEVGKNIYYLSYAFMYKLQNTLILSTTLILLD